MPNPDCPDDPSIIQEFYEVEDVNNCLFLLVNHSLAGFPETLVFEFLVVWKFFIRELLFRIGPL